MKTKLIAAIFFGMLTFSNYSFAKECSKAGGSVDIADCHMERYKAADKELNAVYSEAMKSLSVSEKDKLKEAQKAWIKYRDASFTFIIEINKDMKSYGNIVIINYKATLVEKRVLELKYILSGPESSPVKW